MQIYWMPLSCFECRQWSIFTITQLSGGAVMRCTHCGDKALMQEADIDIEKFLSSMKIFMQMACIAYPNIYKLQEPGDHIDPPEFKEDYNLPRLVARQSNQKKERWGTGMRGMFVH